MINDNKNGQRPKGRSQESAKQKYNCSEIKEIENYFQQNILSVSKLKNGYDNYINNAKAYAEYLKNNGLTTSQIRRVYSEIMSAKDVMTLKRLRPRFAYIQGRNQNNRAIKSLFKIVDLGLANLHIKENDSEENIEIKSLKEFMETIVAYLKYYGDKN